MSPVTLQFYVSSYIASALPVAGSGNAGLVLRLSLLVPVSCSTSRSSATAIQGEVTPMIATCLEGVTVVESGCKIQQSVELRSLMTTAVFVFVERWKFHARCHYVV